jgi:hypothetical protein
MMRLVSRHAKITKIQGNVRLKVIVMEKAQTTQLN